MNLRRVIVASLAIISLQSAPSVQPNPETGKRVEQFVEFGLKFFNGINSKPLKQVIKKTKNQHDPDVTDHWYTVTYSGFRVEFLRAKSATGDLLSTVAIFDNSISLPFDIALGDSQAKIIKQLGNPSEMKPTALVYEVGDMYSRSVTFQFKGGVLTQVLWEYEID